MTIAVLSNSPRKRKKNALLLAIGALIMAQNNIVDRPLPPMIKRAYVNVYLFYFVSKNPFKLNDNNNNNNRV